MEIAPNPSCIRDKGRSLIKCFDGIRLANINIDHCLVQAEWVAIFSNKLMKIFLHLLQFLAG